MLSKINTFSSKYLIGYYFLLSGIDGVLLMFGMLSLTKLSMIIAIMSIIMAIEQFIYKRRSIDYLVLLFIFSIILLSSLMDYDFTLFHFGIRYQLLLMLFFWVGKSRYMADWSFFEKGKIPILIIAFIGLLLFFLSPNWYVSYKLNSRDLGTNAFFLEMTRLSAFWTYPYWISYGCAILYYYILCKFYVRGVFVKKAEVLILSFMLLVIILSQQRAPLGFVLGMTILFFVLSLNSKKNRMKYLRNQLFLLILIIIVSVYILMLFLDGDRLAFMLDKVMDLNRVDNESFIGNRFEMFMDVSNKGYTLLGEGIGKYSHAAYQLNKPAITDNQYLAILYETGYAGFLGYALIIGATLIKGLKNMKYCIFELGIILFYLLAMTGANPLSVAEEHTIVFWICCGRVFNKQCLDYKKEEEKLYNYL